MNHNTRTPTKDELLRWRELATVNGYFNKTDHAIMAYQAGRDSVAYTGELPELPPSYSVPGYNGYSKDDMQDYARQAIAGALAKAGRSEPVAWTTNFDLEGVLTGFLKTLVCRSMTVKPAFPADQVINIYTTPQPAPAAQPVGINGLTEAETDASMSVFGLSAPQPAQDVPEVGFGNIVELARKAYPHGEPSWLPTCEEGKRLHDAETELISAVMQFAQPVATRPKRSEFESLLGEYWDIAHSEGDTGVPRSAEANEVLHKLRALVRPVSRLSLSAQKVQVKPEFQAKVDAMTDAAVARKAEVKESLTPQSAQPAPQAQPEKELEFGYDTAPQPVGINGLTEDETSASMSVRGLSEPAPATPQPAPTTERPQNCGTGHCSCIECPFEPSLQSVAALKGE